MVPLFSIIVPVYNVEKYLEECLDSIINQANQDFELILVNDGSTDGSGAICEMYKELYPKKVKLICQENSGVLMARRTGFQASAGDYIVSVDSDDYLMPGIIESLSSVIKQYHCDMVIFDYIYGAGQNKPERIISVCPEKITTYFTGENILRFRVQLIAGNNLNSLCCKVVKRSCIDIDTDYSQWKFVANGDDSFQSLPILDVVESVCYIPKTGYFYRRDNISLSKFYKAKDFDSFMCVYKRTLKYAKRWSMSSDVLRQVQSRYASLLSVVIHQTRKGISKKDYHAFLKYISKNGLFIDLCRVVHVENWYQKMFFALLSREKIELLPVFMTVGKTVSSIKKHLNVNQR